MTTESLGAETRKELHHHIVVCVAGDPDVLTVLRRSLHSLPCHTHMTDRTDEAISLLTTSHVSLVLADQKLRSMSGQEFLQVVARYSPTTARVLLAPYREPHDIIKTEDDTVHGIIGKPWDGRSLQRTILAILKWQEERSRLALDTRSLPLTTPEPAVSPQPREDRAPARGKKHRRS